MFVCCTVVVVQLQKPAEKVGLSGVSPLATPQPASLSHSGFSKSFRELPARYRRKPLDQIEIEYIQVAAYLSAGIIITSGGAKRLPASIVFTHGLIFWVFALQGRHIAPNSTNQGEIWQVLMSASVLPVPNFTLIILGVWVYGPKTLKIRNFTNIIGHKERIPCTILTKFTGFMRVLRLHNSAKFGCFSSINDKTIQNLTRWGHFQPNFR